MLFLISLLFLPFGSCVFHGPALQHPLSDSAQAIFYSSASRDLRKEEKACSLLRTALGESLVTIPTGAEYVNLAHKHYSETSYASPSCIVSPRTTEHVQSAMKVVNWTRARFAIRGGGHNPNPEAANTEGGVLFSMAEGMITVEYNETSTHVKIGAGNTWGPVLSTLDPFGRAAVSGRLGDVGVGGFLLGGGLSHLTNKHGLGCDTVVEYEIVLFDGKIAIANSEENSDLFWALKGGLNNFGVVTHFTLETYPIAPKVWGGLIVYSMAQIGDFIDALMEYEETGGDQEFGSAILPWIVPTSGLLMINYFSEDISGKPTALAPFLNRLVPLQDTTAVSTYGELIIGGIADVPGINRWAFGERTIDFSALRGAFNSSLAEFAAAPITPGTTEFIIMSQPVLKRGVEGSRPNIRAVERNAMGLKDKSQIWFSVNAGWGGVENDEVAINAVISALDAVAESAKSTDSLHEFIYSNDAGYFQSVMPSYGASNLAKLQKVSKKYDPGQVFQSQVTGGFKLAA